MAADDISVEGGLPLPDRGQRGGMLLWMEKNRQGEVFCWAHSGREEAGQEPVPATLKLWAFLLYSYKGRAHMRPQAGVQFRNCDAMDIPPQQ